MWDIVYGLFDPRFHPYINKVFWNFLIFVTGITWKLGSFLVINFSQSYFCFFWWGRVEAKHYNVSPSQVKLAISFPF